MDGPKAHCSMGKLAHKATRGISWGPTRGTLSTIDVALIHPTIGDMAHPTTQNPNSSLMKKKNSRLRRSPEWIECLFVKHPWPHPRVMTLDVRLFHLLVAWWRYQHTSFCLPPAMEPPPIRHLYPVIFFLHSSPPFLLHGHPPRCSLSPFPLSLDLAGSRLWWGSYSSSLRLGGRHLGVVVDGVWGSLLGSRHHSLIALRGGYLHLAPLLYTFELKWVAYLSIVVIVANLTPLVDCHAPQTPYPCLHDRTCPHTCNTLPPLYCSKLFELVWPTHWLL